MALPSKKEITIYVSGSGAKLKVTTKGVKVVKGKPQ